MGSRSDLQVEVEPLTGRQREVLAMIARGYTNPQIADALGVTIDGAKWHVREIMSKLGVDSREEAAEWWRRERSASSRLRRAVRGLMAAPWGRVAAWGSVGVVGVVMAVATVFVLQGRGEPMTGVDPSIVTTGTVAATGTPDGTPAQEAGLLGEIDGVPVYELEYVDTPASLPSGSLLYYMEQCGTCESGALHRRYEASPGEWVDEALEFGGAAVPTGVSLGPFVSDGSGRFAVAWCLSEQGSCGKQHSTDAPPAAPQVVLLSADGGVTWAPIATIAQSEMLAGFASDQVVVVGPYDGGDVPPDYRLLPSGDNWSPPAEWGWIEAGRYFLDVSSEEVAPGALAYPPSTLLRDTSAANAPYLAFAGGDLRSLTGTGEDRLLAVANRNSKAVLNADPDRVFEAILQQLVIVDIAGRKIHPLDTSLTTNPNAPFVTPLEVRVADIARVNAPGSCLNVRAEAVVSSTSLGCFADGVLLYDLDEVREADGVSWLRVETPDGRDGWASVEFLERLR